LFLRGESDADLSVVFDLNEPVAAPATGDLMYEGSGGAGGGTTGEPFSGTYNVCIKSYKKTVKSD